MKKMAWDWQAKKILDNLEELALQVSHLILLQGSFQGFSSVSSMLM